MHRINKRFKQKVYNNIWVTIDGPKNTEDKLKQKEMQNYMNLSMIPTRKRKIFGVNYGCRDGVINGITWFFKHNKEGM